MRCHPLRPASGLLEDGCSNQRQLDVFHDPIGLDQAFDDLLIVANVGERKQVNLAARALPTFIGRTIGGRPSSASASKPVR